MNPPKISILVPCCNVEKYLRQCLDSIVGQTLKDMEIIVINDGSTDGTLNIINEYAARDARIRVLDKENEGYGKSMNRGLDMARGEYIGIVESDDWVDADMFESLVSLADRHKADVVKSNFYKYTTTDGEKNILRRNMPDADCGRVIVPRKNTAIFYAAPSIWAAIYRRDFLVKNDIRFLESPGASYQDTGFNFKVWSMAGRAFLTEKAYLHYRCDNENSSVKSNGKIFCICDEWAEIERYIAHRGLYDVYKDVMSQLKLDGYMWNMGRLLPEGRAQFVQKFRDEYTDVARCNQINRNIMDDKTYVRLMRVLYPHSMKWRIQRHFWNIVRPIYKTRINLLSKEYYLFNKRFRTTEG